jgi:hypothetical protein
MRCERQDQGAQHHERDLSRGPSARFGSGAVHPHALCAVRLPSACAARERLTDAADGSSRRSGQAAPRRSGACGTLVRRRGLPAKPCSAARLRAAPSGRTLQHRRSACRRCWRARKQHAARRTLARCSRLPAHAPEALPCLLLPPPPLPPPRRTAAPAPGCAALAWHAAALWLRRCEAAPVTVMPCTLGAPNTRREHGLAPMWRPMTS